MEQKDFVKSIILETNLGPIEVELYWDHAPKSCFNFKLCAQSVYNGCKFHTVSKNYIAQTGCPQNTGKGGISVYGGYFPDEIHPDLKFTGAGILAMASAGKDLNGSQFFLTLGLTPDLNGKYTIFGRVKKGIEVLKKINSIETEEFKPKIDIFIKNTSLNENAIY